MSSLKTVILKFILVSVFLVPPCCDYEAADSEPAASTVPHLESRIFRPLVFRDSASYQIGSEKHMDKHVNNRNMDITIQTGKSLPELQKCNKCCSDFHCPFCAPIYFKPTKLSKVQKHVKGHFNRAVQHEGNISKHHFFFGFLKHHKTVCDSAIVCCCIPGYTIHRCGRPCRTQQHYHCLYCESTILRKPDFITHLGSCKYKHAKRASATDACNGTPTAEVEEFDRVIAKRMRKEATFAYQKQDDSD
ncbi:uncharacterized protein LOC131534323 isoform X1 [Onychostoma macrolepis]|uniref:uncharacterized protein LOC131534323 isoform X1 n=1 Tax=Onychostoma macrolepis TaxID=369639 RepID=UPI00272AAA41|nr:uncharacterized protein LOC131534323 isoform X1 [Onychostoma macrolepis]